MIHRLDPRWLVMIATANATALVVLGIFGFRFNAARWETWLFCFSPFLISWTLLLIWSAKQRRP